MASCREDTGCELAVLRLSHSRVLWVVLAINGAMFLVESTAGRLAHSSSLLADALAQVRRLCARNPARSRVVTGP